jgi:hypothetical protein
MVYEAISQLRQADLKDGHGQVEQNKAQRERAIEQEKEALDREAANQADSGAGFFDCMGRVLGEGTNLLVLEARPDDVVDAAKKAWTSPKFWHELHKGLDDVAIVSDAVASAAQEIGGDVGAAVAVVATGVSSAATAGGALAGCREEYFAAAATDAHADATAAQHRITRLQQLVEWMLDDVKEQDKSHQRALGSIQGAMQTNEQTTAIAASITVRG